MDRWNGTDGQNGGEDKMEQVDKTNKVDKSEQVEMEFHMIDIIYAALPMGRPGNNSKPTWNLIHLLKTY